MAFNLNLIFFSIYSNSNDSNSDDNNGNSKDIDNDTTIRETPASPYTKETNDINILDIDIRNETKIDNQDLVILHLNLMIMNKR